MQYGFDEFIDEITDSEMCMSLFQRIIFNLYASYQMHKLPKSAQDALNNATDHKENSIYAVRDLVLEVYTPDFEEQNLASMLQQETLIRGSRWLCESYMTTYARYNHAIIALNLVRSKMSKRLYDSLTAHLSEQRELIMAEYNYLNKLVN